MDEVDVKLWSHTDQNFIFEITFLGHLKKREIKTKINMFYIINKHGLKTGFRSEQLHLHRQPFKT